MKNLIYVFALLITTGLSAQDNPPVNVQEETETKITTSEVNGELVEKKVQVNTKQVQEVKFDERDKNKVNQDQIPSPTQVTETVTIDNDTDPFHESKTTTVFYTMKDQQFIFIPNSNGFTISYTKEDDTTSFGNAMKSSSGNHYLLRTNLYSGVGFFDNEGNFIFEYFDDKTNNLVSQHYMISN